MTLYSQICYSPYGFSGYGARCITSFGAGGRDSLNWPWYCDMDQDHNIFLADTENHRIKFYQSRTFRPGMKPFGDDNPQSACCLLQPKSVKRSYIPGTDLLVADTGNRRIALLRIDELTSQAEHAHSFGPDYFAEPTDCANDPHTGNIVVVDTGLNNISIHNQKGQLLAVCEQVNFSFKEPSAVAIAKNGEIFVSDTGNNCIRRFKQNGAYIGCIGSKGKRLRQFDHPRGLAFDNKGYFYVADEYNNRVQRFSPDLTHVMEVVSSIPLPKGVAAGNQLIVTSADATNFVKVYYP